MGRIYSGNYQRDSLNALEYRSERLNLKYYKEY